LGGGIQGELGGGIQGELGGGFILVYIRRNKGLLPTGMYVF